MNCLKSDWVSSKRKKKKGRNVGVCWEVKVNAYRQVDEVAFTLTGIVLEKGIRPSLGNIVCLQKEKLPVTGNDRGEEKWALTGKNRR